jgi:hypothetical protein
MPTLPIRILFNPCITMRIENLERPLVSDLFFCTYKLFLGLDDQNHRIAWKSTLTQHRISMIRRF